MELGERTVIIMTTVVGQKSYGKLPEIVDAEAEQSESLTVFTDNCRYRTTLPCSATVRFYSRFKLVDPLTGPLCP